MKENWFKKHGFENNPLSIKSYQNNLIGFEKEIEELVESLNNKKSIWAIYGDFGSGKTTLIKKLLSEYKNSIYFSHSRIDGSMNVKRLLQIKTSFFLRLIGKIPKNLIVFFDEAHELNSKEVKELLKYYENGSIKNLILINPDNIIDVKNKINLSVISKKDAVELIHLRLKDKDLISIDAIVKIYDLVEGNPRKILEYCEHAIKIADDIGDGRATDKHVILLRELINSKNEKNND